MVYRGYLCSRIHSCTEVVPPYHCNKIIRNMDEKSILEFTDKSITFDQFVDFLATKVALRIHQIEKGELEVSQSQAYKLFGRADVERWIRNGKLHPVRISPGKKRFSLVDLQKLASIQQNYLL